MMPIWVADAKGFWKDLNLDVEVVTFQSGGSLAQAILGNAVQVGAGAFAEAIPLAAKGVPTKVLSTFNTNLPFVVIARPEIENMQQLAGKTVGISSPGSLTDVTLRIVMKKHGLDPSSVKYQNAGASAPRLAALTSGQIDATLLDGANAATAIKDGFHQIASMADDLPGFPFETIYAKSDYTQANRDAMVRLMMGIIRASRYGIDPANRDEVIQIVQKATGLDPKDIGVNYDQTIKSFPPDAPVGIDAAKTALEGFAEFGNVPGLDKLTIQDVTDESIQQDALARLGG